MDGDTCHEPPPNVTEYHAKTPWDFFKLCHGVMQSIIGEVDSEVRMNTLRSMNDPYSPYYNVRRYAWRNGTFLLLYFGLILTAVLIVLAFSYRILYNWVTERRKHRKRPKSIITGYLMLLFGIVASIWCVIIFWEGLTAIQVRQRSHPDLVSEEYISKYSDAVACGVHQVEAILDKKHYKKRDTSYSGSDSEVLDALKRSVAAIRNLTTLTANCSSSALKGLNNYVAKFGATGGIKSQVTPSAPRKDAKTLISDYLVDSDKVLNRLRDFANKNEREEREFIEGNEYPSAFKIMLLLTLALPAVLFLLCLSGIIILATYTVIEQVRQGSPNRTLYDFLSVILQTYGYVGMIVAAVFFLTTALFLVTGFSSSYICDKILASPDGKDDLYLATTVSLEKVPLTVDVKEAFHRCVHGATFHDAFMLKRLISADVETGQRDDPISKAVADNLYQTAIASGLSSLKSNSCIAGNATDFDKVLKQVGEGETRVKNAEAARSKKMSSSAASDEVVNSIDNALRLHSPKCVHLVSSMTTTRRFCKSKPPYFQGLSVACGITAIVSIHTYGVMFDGSDMVKPKEHAASEEEDEGKGKESGTAASEDEGKEKEKGKDASEKNSKDVKKGNSAKEGNVGSHSAGAQ